MKRSKHLRGWNKRFFVLYEDRILYYRTGASKPRGVIHLAIVKAVKTVGTYQIDLVAGTKTIALKAGTKEERHEWVEMLQAQRISERNKRRQSRKKVSFVKEEIKSLVPRLRRSASSGTPLSAIKARQMEAVAREATKSHSSFKPISTLQSGTVGPIISEVTSYSENSFQRRISTRRLTEIKSFGPKKPYTRTTPPPPPKGRKLPSSPAQKKSPGRVLPQTPPPSKSGLPMQVGHEI